MAVVVCAALAVRWMRAERSSRLSVVPEASERPHDGDDSGGAPRPSPVPVDAAPQVARALELRLQMAEQADLVASTEDAVAATFERLAGRGGPRESERRATAREARDHAELERRRAAHYRATSGTEDAASAPDESGTASAEG